MADEKQSVATLPAQSEGLETPTKEVQPEGQPSVESQSAGTPQVEGVDNKPQVQENSRPYDGLFRQERKRIRRLEETNQQLLQKLTDFESLLKQKDSPEQPLDPSLILTDPDRYLSAREQKLMKEIESLRGEVTNWKQTQEIQEKERRGLEALEKLFPKNSPDSNESLAERVNKDPERAERLKEFFSRPAIKAMSEIDPDEAVDYALEKLGYKEAKPNPLVLKKNAMGGIASGNPSGGSKTSTTLDDLRSQLKRLNRELDNDPSLRYDEKYVNKKKDIIESLERLIEKK